MTYFVRVHEPLRMDTTTFHTSKLFVSSDQVLCGPCQRLLSGRNTLLRTEETNGKSYFTHHATPESFQEALALSCGICRRLKVEIDRDLRMTNPSGILYVPLTDTRTGHRSRGPFQVAPTEYVTQFEADREERMSLWFICNRSYVPLHLVPEKDTNLSQGHLPAHSGLLDVDTSLTADNTGSEACISFALSQLRRCRATHTECWKIRQSRQEVSAFVPTRVLDVGYAEASTICLLQNEDCVKMMPYIALSHCWGGSQPFKLTRATVARLKAGIQLTDLPKTFQDAIYVARKMQIQYLWIDSLYVADEATHLGISNAP